MATSIHDVAVALAQAAERVCQALLPDGKRIGRDWVVGDVFGKKGESLQVALEGERAGLWHDKATDEGGDMIDLVSANRLLSKGKAAAWGCEFLGIPNDYRNGHSSTPTFDPLKFGIPSKSAPEGYEYGSAYWTYHDASGGVLGHVVRFNQQNGDKRIMPIRFIDGKPRWKGWARPEPRPLFNLHKLARNPDRTVLIVEGEKTAIAAEKLFSNVVVTTFMGGTSNVDQADYEPIKGRNIVLWPDADKHGREAMLYLKSRFPDAKLVDTSSLPPKWDLADPCPEGVSIQGLFDGAGDLPKPKPAKTISQQFRCLGHDESGFYYLSFKSGRIQCMTAVEHTEMNLQTISDDAFWRASGITDRHDNVDWKAVAKHLIDLQWGVGVYDPDNIRGRGCWMEGKTVVYHAGDHLIVDGISIALFEHKSKFIYPLRKAIEIDLSKSATTQQTQKLVKMIDLLPWADSSMSWRFAGLLFLCPICGVLDWRPTGWLIGESGTGKSYTYANIVLNLVGPGVKAASSTTAAAVRQMLGCDALPVLIDEMEAKDQASILRVVAHLEQVRQSSCENGASIYKGSPSGVATRYSMRAMHFFSSIAMGATEAADESRVCRLEFKSYKNASPEIRKARQEAFAEIQALASETSQDLEFCSAFVSRAVRFAGRVREAAVVYGKHITRVSGDARKGQQYGAIAAGYWYLNSDIDPTEAEVIAFVEAVDWDLLTNTQSSDSDQIRASDVLLQAKIEMLDKDGKAWRYNIGEVLNIYYENDIRRDAAKDALMRVGIHPIYVDGERIDIAIRHSELRKIFSNTQFADRWPDYFNRLQGSQYRSFVPRGGHAIRSIRVLKSAIITTEQQEL